MKAPPRTGPNTDATPETIPMNDVYIGRLRRGMMGRIIIILPVKIPAEARPATALPMIKVIELGAAPQTAEPTSKTTSETRKAHFVE